MDLCGTGHASVVGRNSRPYLLYWTCDKSSRCPMNDREHWQSQVACERIAELGFLLCLIPQLKIGDDRAVVRAHIGSDAAVQGAPAVGKENVVDASAETDVGHSRNL